nr:hypothetical protein [Gammaproteobacteria bacterium AqS3]
PEHVHDGLSPERIAELCMNECYHPSDVRRRITRIEIVRIRPQISPDEDVAGLIEDPWRTFECEDDPSGCSARFQDGEYPRSGRPATYYARAIQEPTPAVNGGGARCEYDEAGNCIRPNFCHGDWRTDPDDDCLVEVEERAWSSPIYLTPPEWRTAGR